MNKKAYLKPAMQVVMIQQAELLQASGQKAIQSFKTNMPEGDVIGLGGSDADLGENPIVR
jgi:hypothetical protein